MPGEAGVPAYPALVDGGDAVSLRVFADRNEADANHPQGVRRLLEIALADKAKSARKQLPVSPKTGLLYAAIESQERLRGDLVGAALNALLHEYGGYIIGRMGLPYRERGVNIISVVLDAPQDKIAALSGKIGRLPGVSAKTQYSNVISREGENQ